MGRARPDRPGHPGVDLGTTKSQQIRVTASGGLTLDEIDRLVDEAENNATDDEARREAADLINKADGLTYSTERTLEEYAEHIDEEARQSLLSAIEKTRSAMSTSDAGALAVAVDELSALSYQMTEQLYAALGDGGDDEE